MTLKLYSSGMSLVREVSGIDYLFQAEQWVIDNYKDYPTVPKLVLFDRKEEVQVWERPIGSLDCPKPKKEILHRDFNL